MSSLRTSIYSHLDANSLIPPEVLESAIGAVEGYSLRIEKHRTASLRKSLIKALVDAGWTKEISIGPDSQNRITAMKGSIGLCLQTGNTAALYRDLFKLMYMHKAGSVTAGIYIVPRAQVADILGTNYATMEKLVSELKDYSPVVTLPVLVIGFSQER